MVMTDIRLPRPPNLKKLMPSRLTPVTDSFFSFPFLRRHAACAV